MISGLTVAAAPPVLPSPGVQGVDWVVAPVALVAAAALLVLLVEAAVPGRRRLLDAVALAGLGLAGAALAVGATRIPPGGRGTFCLPTGECSYLLTPLTLPVQALVLGGAALCLLMAVGETPAARAEHHLLLLAATCGALTLAAARDLATLVVALETASLPVVGLVALRRTASGAEAALKLLLTSVVSLGLVVTGVALLYAATGSLHLSRVAAGLGELVAGSTPSATGALLPVAVLGVLLTVSGLAFKLSAVPFHLWTPDTYAGAPVAAAAFLAVVSKAAALVALVLVLVVGAPALAGVWAPVVGVLAVASMTVGNLVALRQLAAVRLLAWSTVAQAGWVLLPLAGAVGGRPAQLRGAAAASLGYLLAYALASLAAFAVVVLVARRSPAGPGHGLDAYTGLVRSRPFEAVVLGFALACLAGLPPGVMGLVAKVLALRPVVESGSWVLAVAAAVNVALGLAYYLAWGARLFARAPVSAQAPAPASPAASPAPSPAAPLPGRSALAREPLHDLAASDAHAEADLRAPARPDRDDVPPAPGDPALRAAAGIAAAGCVLLSAAPQLLAGLLPGGLG